MGRLGGGGGCCKEWWDGNSFTAGRPQGSTFSTGTLSWKRERGSCYCFCCEVKGHHDIQALSHTPTLVTRQRTVMLLKRKSKTTNEQKLECQDSQRHVRGRHIQDDVKNSGVKWHVAQDQSELPFPKQCKDTSNNTDDQSSFFHTQMRLWENYSSKSYQIAFCYPYHFTLWDRHEKDAVSVWLKVPHYVCLQRLQQSIIDLFCSRMKAKPSDPSPSLRARWGSNAWQDTENMGPLSKQLVFW